VTARVLAVGDNVVDCYPDLGEMFPGGNAVNVAVHAQRNGAAASYLGVLGTDEAGDLLRRALTDEGIDTSLTRHGSGPNAYAIVRLVAGNRIFEKGHVGVSRFTVTDEELEAVRRADLVHTGECSMVEDDLTRLASAARVLSFDFSERPWDYVARYAPHVSIATLSASAEEDPATLATRVAELGPSTVVVTQGALGATMNVDGRIVQAPAGSGPIVDTLGAGDALIARILVGIATGEQPQSLLSAATEYATRTCADHGAFGYRTHLPARYRAVTDAGVSS
jgi:sugar/nucleoside kinase (ribokinase family)